MILKLRIHNKKEMKLFDALIPFFRKIEQCIKPPFGLSIVSVSIKN